MLVHLTKRTKFLVCVRLFNKRTNTNELPAERFTNCSPNVWFVCSPSYRCGISVILYHAEFIYIHR
ncbi:hypothetical protein HanRHA438_Chr06g0282871 [Helianthus annuus]|nr:hypothetical protein HanRHA438_Chr06g0282871 [Helianthus annuus]